jgi:hypothetical protein
MADHTFVKTTKVPQIQNYKQAGFSWTIILYFIYILVISEYSKPSILFEFSCKNGSFLIMPGVSFQVKNFKVNNVNTGIGLFIIIGDTIP